MRIKVQTLWEVLKILFLKLFHYNLICSHTTHVVRVKFNSEWQDLKIKVETFHGSFTYSQSFDKKTAERKAGIKLRLLLGYIYNNQYSRALCLKK